ncbi:unnamed protein product [Larinioides sclopetarius]|uniref:Uncharacterized protein n=1 Tax=Larinioides sclopetarius TaxID=280406 RepID=A0AAV2BTA0_9ARAC
MRPRLCADTSNIILRTLWMFDWEGWLMVNWKVSCRRIEFVSLESCLMLNGWPCDELSRLMLTPLQLPS